MDIKHAIKITLLIVVLAEEIKSVKKQIKRNNKKVVKFFVKGV